MIPLEDIDTEDVDVSLGVADVEDVLVPLGDLLIVDDKLGDCERVGLCVTDGVTVELPV